MPDFLISAPYVMLFVLLAALVGVATTMAAAFVGEGQRRRYPQAVELENVGALVSRARGELSEANAKLDAVNRQIENRDRVVAEAIAAQQTLEAVRLELAGLADARAQIDEVKRSAVEAAAELAAKQSDLTEVLERLEAARQQITRADTELRDRLSDVADLDQKISERRAELGRMPDALKAEIDLLEARIDSLRSELDEKRVERAMLVSAQAEVAELSSRKAALAVDVEGRQRELQELAEKKASGDRVLAELSAKGEDLRGEVDRARSSLDRARQDLAGVDERRREAEEQLPSLASKLEVRQAECKALEVAAVAKRDDLAELRKERDAVLADLTIARASADIASRELEAKEKELETVSDRLASLTARCEALQVDIDKPRAGEAGASGRPVFGPEVIEDLERLPEALTGLPQATYRPEREAEAINGVMAHLRDLQLEYPDRAIRAFHTALKINDFAQLTVLAGVSGTGKSLLPRRYAEAMGMRFLPIAVEPRWDSPQDLLGFYNYIEKRFRATDLARALVHLDPYNTSKLAGANAHSEDMMIVLLDEMNLARVEYYFSEFLSRLEARPKWRDGIGEEERRDAMIPVDIRGRPEGPIRLYPPHNMLFVGTMNDDESTQSLSDKVLDRGNIMQFAAPEKFAEVKKQEAAAPPGRRLSFRTWRSWLRTSESLGDANKSFTRNAIEDLAKVMNACGRPFGHRLSAAILAYVANYPQQNERTADVRLPLSDQVELRIMPKLRGLNIEEHHDAFERLHEFIRDNLDDAELSQRFKELYEKQTSAGGLFNWRGLTRTGHS